MPRSICWNVNGWIDHNILADHGFPTEKITPENPIYEAVGCDECRGTGYRGRSGIFEILPITDEIRPLIVANATASSIKQAALANGMKTLRQDGWEKVLSGVTTVDEILRVTEEVEIEDD